MQKSFNWNSKREETRGYLDRWSKKLNSNLWHKMSGWNGEIMVCGASYSSNSPPPILCHQTAERDCVGQAEAANTALATVLANTYLLPLTCTKYNKFACERNEYYGRAFIKWCSGIMCFAVYRMSCDLEYWKDNDEMSLGVLMLILHVLLFRKHKFYLWGQNVLHQKVKALAEVF